MHAGLICEAKWFKCVNSSWRSKASAGNCEEKDKEPESDTDQSGSRGDQAASAPLAPTANQHDRVYICPRNRTLTHMW